MLCFDLDLCVSEKQKFVVILVLIVLSRLSLEDLHHCAGRKHTVLLPFGFSW